MHIIFIILGYISTVLTSIAYVPQIITVLIHKSGKNISYPYLLLITFEILFYLIYGIGFILDNNLDAIPIIVGGTMQIILVMMLLVLKFIFNVKKKCLHKKSNNIENIENTEHVENTENTENTEHLENIENVGDVEHI